MTYNEAEDIIYFYELMIDRDCSCFQGNPPCSRCESLPDEEQYTEALKRIERGY